MEALLIPVLLVMGISVVTLAAWLRAVKRNEHAQERAMLQSRLVAISTRQRRDAWYDD